MSVKKIIPLFFCSIFLLICFLAVLKPSGAQDDNLPPIVINAGDFPCEQGQTVTMQKQLWGDKNEVSIELSVVSGTKSISGVNAQVVKTFDTGGEFAEDYFTKDGSTLMYVGTTRENLDKLVPSKNFQFPLQLNKEWVVLDKEISGKHVKITASVVSQEFVKVPAGIFQSLKIEVISGFADEKSVKNSEIWVVPGKGIVKELRQIDEHQTQIRELMSFQAGGQSLSSIAGSIPAGGNAWKGSGKSLYRSFAKYPGNSKTLEQTIEMSYNFSFTIDSQTGLIKGEGQVSVDKYKNSWNGNSVDGNNKSGFTFIGKKEGETLKFYDGFLSLNPEKVKVSGTGDIPLLKALDHAFRLSVPISGGKATAKSMTGNKDGAYIDIQWQAGQ